MVTGGLRPGSSLAGWGAEKAMWSAAGLTSPGCFLAFVKPTCYTPCRCKAEVHWLQDTLNKNSPPFRVLPYPSVLRGCSLSLSIPETWMGPERICCGWFCDSASPRLGTNSRSLERSQVPRLLTCLPEAGKLNVPNCSWARGPLLA